MVRVALLLIILAEGALCAMNVGLFAPTFPIAIGASLLLGLSLLYPKAERLGLGASVLLGALALAVVWGAFATDAHAAHVMRDLGWTQFALAMWTTYSTLAERSRRNLGGRAFDDEVRALWRSGDESFAGELAEQVFVGAQPSWAALVVETAWPEPRPKAVAELLETGATATATELEGLHARLEGDEPRSELARIACDVIAEARNRPTTEAGGAAAGRFVMAAARAAADDEAAMRIFAALVLPAVARRG